MDADGLKALFEPFGAVTVKRMFGGAGIYAEGVCFAIESDGEVFLKTDSETQASFSAAGSPPFVYNASGAFPPPPMTSPTTCAAGPRWVSRRPVERPSSRRSPNRAGRVGAGSGGGSQERQPETIVATSFAAPTLSAT